MLRQLKTRELKVTVENFGHKPDLTTSKSMHLNMFPGKEMDVH
jgi:hypothetical protein